MKTITMRKLAEQELAREPRRVWMLRALDEAGVVQRPWNFFDSEDLNEDSDEFELPPSPHGMAADARLVPVVPDINGQTLEIINARPFLFDMRSFHDHLNQGLAESVGLGDAPSWEDIAFRRLRDEGATVPDPRTCGTTHCRAGWAVALTSGLGIRLEKDFGPETAGFLIIGASCPWMDEAPGFYGSDRFAKMDIEAAALREIQHAAKAG